MLILNIQFWDQDKDQAMQLARLLADLQPSYRKDVTVLFSARFDCTHDEDTIKYVSKKFPVQAFTSRVKSTGWPRGCNQLMADSYGHCIELVRDRKVDAKAVMFIEADCVPLNKDWLQLLINEYLTCGKQVLGPWLKKGDASIEHVNGNCIIDINFWRKNRMILSPPAHGGWDATCKNIILPNAAPSKLIYSDYQLGTEKNPWRGCEYLWEAKCYGASDNPLFGQDLYPVWYHGCKTSQAIECVRGKLIPKTFSKKTLDSGE